MNRPDAPGRADPTIRHAARWATAVAVPVAVLVGWLLVAVLGSPAAPPVVSPAAPRAQASTPVEVPAPPLGGQPAQACQRLTTALPDAIRDLRRRPVTAGPGQNAAYGDPPITVSCGVPATSFPPNDVVYRADAVCWHAPGAGQPPAGAPEPGRPAPGQSAPGQPAAATTQPTVWTTVDREVPVRVVLPAEYQTAAVQWLNEFSDAIAGAIGRLPDPGYGCTD